MTPAASVLTPQFVCKDLGHMLVGSLKHAADTQLLSNDSLPAVSAALL